MPGTTRVSFHPSRATPPWYRRRIATSLPLRSCLTPCHPPPSGDTMLTDGSQDGAHRVGRAMQRDSFYLSRCSRLECGMTVFAIT
ncbi:hypothetical protein PUN28_014236 [Cardiocondyla obscurior]|uniref:Uncharacterized protein n=1 Tax=Cardiocondyla obscurior TaxID=286306 RepID=A0AAW2EZ29_9HYME